MEKTFSGQMLCSCAFDANIRSYTKRRARHGTPFLQPPPPPSAGVHVTPPPQSNFQVALTPNCWLRSDVPNPKPLPEHYRPSHAGQPNFGTLGWPKGLCLWHGLRLNQFTRTDIRDWRMEAKGADAQAIPKCPKMAAGLSLTARTVPMPSSPPAR